MSRGDAPRIPWLLAIAAWGLFGASPALAQMRSATGSYVGNGLAGGHSITVGFAPDVVFVKGDTTQAAVVRTSTMAAGSKDLNLGGVLAAGLITGLTATGFNVGDATIDARVNQAGTTYYWTALKAAAGELQVGTYTGNGTSQTVPVAFQPDWVAVFGDGAGILGCHRNSAMAGDVTVFFRNSGAVASTIQALVPTGFQVGSGAHANNNTVAFHFVAVKNIPGRSASGVYRGYSNDNRNISGLGFRPNWVIVRSVSFPRSSVARPHSLAGDASLSFVNTAAAPNQVQALLPDGFQIGSDPAVNASSEATYMWVAFGGAVNYRSIGVAPAYTAGTVAATTGSAVVTGTGTAWASANRGRGDRMLIDGTNYTVFAVDSETQLRLTTAFTGTTGSGKAYTLSRQYSTLQAWEDCISFLTPTSCTWFQVASASLVADLRSEVGIAYDDAVGADFTAGLVIDNSVTDAGHTITLTADGANRHYGMRNVGVLIDNGASVTPAVQVYDNFVTVEWMQVTGGSASADGIRVNLLSAGTGSLVTVRDNLVRNVPGDGVAIYDPDGRVDVVNNIVHGCVSGLWLNMGSLVAGSRFRALNNTFYGNLGGVAKAAGASAAATLLLRNNISFGNTSAADYDPDPADSLDPASSHNLSEDASATPASPAGGAQVGVTLAQIAFHSTTAGSEDLHIRSTSVAKDQGTDLSAIFADDVDEDPRPRGAQWDKGADETGTEVNFRSIGTAADLVDQGTITLTAGSTTVTKTGGTGWKAANRGRGDRFTVGANHYQVLGVDSDNQLRLASPAVASYTGSTYTIARQFTTLQSWENCVSRSAANTCKRPADTQEYFATATSSLVADDRAEIGIAYDDATPSFFLTSNVRIQDSTTDAAHTITLTADGVNRHNGVPGAGVVIDLGYVAPSTPAYELSVRDSNVTVEWLELVNCRGADSLSPIEVSASSGDLAENVLLQNLLIHDYDDGNRGNSGIDLAGDNASGSRKVVTIRNTMIWDGDSRGIEGDEGNDVATIENVSIDGMLDFGIWAGASSFVVRNTIVTDSVGNPSYTADYSPNLGSLSGSNNTDSDGSGAAYFTNAQTDTPGNLFVTPNADLHLKSGAAAENAGLDLSASFVIDIDGQRRPAGGAWDQGADEFGATTAVKLMSLVALAEDRAVTLEWRTGSELGNLGFHVYRGLSPEGPQTRLTSTLIPGLGSSPIGASYSWRDAGLVNGQLYYYRLEDVDTSSRSTFHGPVSAVPVPASPAPGEGGGDDGDGDDGGGDGTERGEGETADSSCPSWILAAAPDAVSPVCTKHGEPDSTSLQVLARGASGATFELRTNGFWALRDAAGEVRVFIPGLDFPPDPKAPALPLRRALVDAVVGKQVHLVSAEALELRSFPGLRPSAVGRAEMALGGDGTVRPSRRSLPARFLSRGLVPAEVARLVGTVFQRERKSAVVEIAPVRFSASRNELVLAGRVRVTLSFAGAAEGEIPTGGGGRVLPRKGQLRDVLARLHTAKRGLHAVRYEDLFPTSRRGVSTTVLRLQRQGEAVPFHVEPSGLVFGPGSVLYFYAERTVTSTEYSSEVAYELVRGAGERMAVVPAAPAGALLTSSSTGFASFETNRVYQPGLLEAPDIWLWDGMGSGLTRTKGFMLSGVDAASGDSARLVVYLQGGSESGTAADHHVRVSVNETFVGEATFSGKRPHFLDVPATASLLREGANELSVTNVGDTGAYSLVFLDRFDLRYPQVSTTQQGVFEGVWAESGTAEVSGVSGPPIVLDLTGAVKWLTGVQATGSSVRFQAEAGHRYAVVSPEGLVSPRIGRVPPSTLKAGTNQADHLVIAPREFLEAALPLVERRRGQGLVSRAVSFEEIASEFGHGQASGEAIKAFLSYAYHSWQRPSPRYVVLLGDATYDPRHFQSTSWASPLPALWVKTSYLWTVSDPALAAVNGEDLLPDMAIGRLPATTRGQAEALVSKLLTWEESGQHLSGRALLVADTPDAAGDFEADVEDVRASFLGDRSTTTLRVRELGAGTRPAILGAFDDGASLASYVGHGGTAVWSSANVLNSWDTPSLLAQSRQPLLLTLNCLNGYFVAPNFDSLSEALVKAEGRGAIAALSPSGLSLDGPAHQYHRATMAEIASGTHARLGDAILAAQAAYAETGLMPELFTIYHLTGDPAMRIQPAP